jgi:hypothetical protein
MRAIPLFVLFALVFSGCANYRLGTDSALSFSTIYVAPLVNESSLPQAVAIVSTQIREAFLKEPRVVLVNTADQADVTLTVHLVKQSRDAQTRLSTDTGLARKFDIKLEAEATLHDNRSNKDIFKDRKLEAVRQVFTDGGQQLQAEYQNVPLLAESLAKSVVGATVDVW